MAGPENTLHAAAFTGQGFVYPRMGYDIEASRHGTELLDIASDTQGSSQIIDVMRNGTKETLTEVRNAHLATYLYAIASYLDWGAERDEQGLFKPDVDFSFGHSLGELAAVCATGALNIPDTVRLVDARGNAMERAIAEQKASGIQLGMTALIGLETDLDQVAIHGICERSGGVRIANDNSPREIVVGGPKDKLEVVAMCAKELLSVSRTADLPVPTAFHTPQMSRATVLFQSYLKGVSFNAPRMPIVYNYDAMPSDAQEVIDSKLRLQISSPVKWRQSVKELERRGVGAVTVFGPGGKQVARLIRDSSMGGVDVQVHSIKGK